MHEEAYTVHYAGVEKQLYAQMKGILLMIQPPLRHGTLCNRPKNKFSQQKIRSQTRFCFYK